MAQEQTPKCNCSKTLKPLEKKIATLENDVSCLKRQIEVLKRALNSKGV